MSGPVERSALRIHTGSKRSRTLTDDEVPQLQEACRRLRDRFLVTLLYESGLRIDEASGLRACRPDPASCAVHVVAREDNPNQVRVKGMKERAVPIRDDLFTRYADYVDTEYGDLDRG